MVISWAWAILDDKARKPEAEPKPERAVFGRSDYLCYWRRWRDFQSRLGSVATGTRQRRKRESDWGHQTTPYSLPPESRRTRRLLFGIRVVSESPRFNQGLPLSEYSAYISQKRADERTRTADLLITSDQSGVAGVAQACKSRISRGVSFLWFAACCTVLRSRWYQSGIRTSDSYTLTVGPMALDLRPSEPQSAVTCFWALLQVAESAYLSRFLCSTVAHRFCVLRSEWCQKWCQTSSLWTGDTGSAR